MGIKIIIFILVLILLAISALLFTVAWLLLNAPVLLAGSLNTGLAIGCIVAGAIILVPILVCVITALSGLVLNLKKNGEPKSGKDS